MRGTIEDVDVGFEPFRPVSAPDGTLWGAAFRSESPLYAMWNWGTRPQFEPQADFDLESRMRESPLTRIDPDAFIGTQSDEEFDYRLSRLSQEHEDRLTMARAGAGGIVAGMAMGLLTPTIFLPAGAITRGATALRSAAKVGSYSAFAVGIDEAILQSDQQLRTAEESALSIGTAALLGGILGAGVAKLLGPDDVARFEAGMAGSPDGTTIQPAAPPSSVGAAYKGPDDLYNDPGRLLDVKFGIGPYSFDLNRTYAWLSPVARNLKQPVSAAVRAAQARIGTAGLYTERTAIGEAVEGIGGDLENLVKQHYGKFAEVKMDQADIWTRYQKELGTPGAIRRLGGSRGLNIEEFEEAVGRALENPDAAENEYVREMAESYRQKLYLPMLQDLKESGILDREISEEAALAYFPRIVRPGMAVAEWNDLQGILREHLEDVFAEDARKYLTRQGERIAQGEQEVADLELDAAGIVKRREELEREIFNLPQEFEPEVRNIAEDIRALRAAAKVEPDAETKKALREEAKALEETNKETLKPFRAAENKLRTAFRNLDNTRSGFEQRQRRALEQLDNVEEQQVATMARAERSIARLAARMEKLTGPALDAEVEKVRGRIEQAFNVYVRGEEKLDKLREVPEGFEELVFSDVRPTEKISKLEDRQAIRAAALDELYSKLDNLEARVDDREALRATMLDLQNDVRRAAQRVNDKRALRKQKLRERAASLSPERQAELVAERRSRVEDIRQQMFEGMAARGIELDVPRDAEGTATVNVRGMADLTPYIDISKKADEEARKMADVFAGNSNINMVSALINERGSELARTLNIDIHRDFSKYTSQPRRYGDFLDWNAERRARTYIRSVGADVEIARKFDGKVQPFRPGSDFDQAIDAEFAEAKKAIEAQDISDAKKQREMEALDSLQKQSKRDLQAQIDRLRHQRGIPDNPQGYGYRLGRQILNLNTMRLMGGVVLSSVPDLARFPFKYGLLNTFRDGFIPMLRDFSSFKMSATEAKYAGTALDLVIHGRASAIFDILDEVEYGTKLERATQWGANNFGKIALFDHWNVGMKSFAAGLTNARLMKSLRDMSEGKLKKADARFLAASNIDENLARRMWEQITQTPGGGNAVNGVWMPNTQAWTDMEALRAYRAALAKSVDETIITPGVERPLWMDQTTWGRIIGQFRSFTFSSTLRIFGAGLQEWKLGNKAPMLSSAIFSLALGALSYYLWAMSRGGDSRERMQQSLRDGDWEKWADEAIARSGLLTALGEVQRVAENIPVTSPYATISGESTSRSPYNQPLLNALGPTFGLAEDVTRLAVTFDDPTSGTVDSARNLTPYQNVSHFALGFQMLEDVTKDYLGVAQ